MIDTAPLLDVSDIAPHWRLEAIALFEGGRLARRSFMDPQGHKLDDWFKVRGGRWLLEHPAPADVPETSSSVEVPPGIYGGVPAAIAKAYAPAAKAQEAPASGQGTAADVTLEPAATLRSNVTCMADVQPEAVTWLWKGRIALGKLSLFDGDPGLGKSTATLDIAARVTTGKAFPDGAACGAMGSVALLTAEDGLADTVRPRLDAAGADVAKVFVIKALIDTSGAEQFPSLGNVPEIEDELRRLGDCRLLIVDPAAAFWGEGVNAHKDQDVRRVLGPLKDMAERLNVAVVMVRHLNKTKGVSAIYRGGGSIGISGAARVALLFAREAPDNPSSRVVVATVKSNLGKPAPSLGYRIEGDEAGVAFVAWERDAVDVSAAQLVAAQDNATPGDGQGAMGFAKRFLTEYLADGARTTRELKAEAKKLGIAERTLERAREALGVLPSRDEVTGGWIVRLPAVEAPGAAETITSAEALSF